MSKLASKNPLDKKVKPLSKEQTDFVEQFITKKSPKSPAAQRQELTSEYQNFLRRKDKVLAEVYKLPLGDPRRKELEKKVEKIDASKQKDGKANFMEAYKALKAMKVEAQEVVKKLDKLSSNRVAQEISQLDTEIRAVATAVAALLAKADRAGDPITRLPKTSSFKDLGDASPADRDLFQKHRKELLPKAEEEARTAFGQLVGEKNALAADLQKRKLSERAQDIRNEIAILEGQVAGSSGLTSALLDKALAGLACQGQLLTEYVLNKQLALREQALAALLAEWKAGAGQDRGPSGPAGRGLLEGVDLVAEDVKDGLLFGKVLEEARVVESPYEWEACSEFDDLTDVLPRSETAVTPATLQAARDAGKKLIADAMKAHANDPKFIFDLSIQTKPTLVTMFLKEAGLESVFEVDDDLVQKQDQLEKASNNENKEVYKRAIKAHRQDKLDYRQSGDTKTYAQTTTGLLKNIKQQIEKLQTKGDSQNTVAALQLLAHQIDKDLKTLPAKQLHVIRQVADDMAAAIALNCPNTSSKETAEFDVPSPQGGTKKLSAPQKITLNKQEYKVKKCVGGGATAGAFTYEDAKGKTVVVKCFKETSETELEKITQELKMHQHLMAGADDDGRNNVLKLEGAVRRPDGGIFMVLEHADGGGLDRLGESMRVLGNGNALSQEAVNAMHQNLVLQAVKGLKYLQERNMLHRDIKADNLFLTADGTVKLADFGVAQLSDNPEGEVPGTAGGAMPFAAPEVRSSAATLTGKADTYTLGTLISQLTSPTDANERLKRVTAGASDYTSPEEMTALDRLKNAMLNKDPNLRPRLEAVEYSSYLADAASHDPNQVQALVQASISYAQKAGKQVGEKQAEINSLQGAILDGDYKAAPTSEDELNKALQDGKALEIIRARLKDSTDKLGNAIMQMETGGDRLSIMQQRIAPALKEARDADKLCTLGNVTDPALRKEVADHIAATLLQYNKLVESFRASIAQQQQAIDDINKQPDVQPLLAKVKEADAALRRGPDAAPEKKAPTAAAIAHQTKQLQALAARLNVAEKFAKTFKEAEGLAKAQQFDEAKGVLDHARQELTELGNQKLEANRATMLGKALAAATTLTPDDAAGLKERLARASRYVEGGKLGPARQLLKEIEDELKGKKVTIGGPNQAPDAPPTKPGKAPDQGQDEQAREDKS